ncbi:hypothetical protein EXIGLDRAFT_745715 [Exidia glandulosa HHB12029]|uniref:F-box domain-containing protein n=1 Tax=Exidia glandulosa HHB12029 TaxID=1314781 RepID=A0A165N543_EXIGL|nr:hypothetical protein EXIGLDRAFT_745715 [Exidia glandulosa HHB12029]
MDRLPPEILAEICAYFTLPDLLSLLTVNRFMHDQSVGIIYAFIRHIHLFSTGEDADLPSLHCLRSLATSKRIASSVRHFALRGLPWQDVSTLQYLTAALCNMERLLSLDMSGASSLEASLLSPEACAQPCFMRNLEAIHVTRPETALYLCDGRTISSVRVASDATSAELLDLLALAGAHLRELQIVVDDIYDPVQALSALKCTIVAAPRLKTLAIEFRVQHAEPAQMHAFGHELTDIMTGLVSLSRLALVVTPMGSTMAPPDCSLATALFTACPNLEYLELQWSVWTATGTTIKTSDSERPWHTRLRTAWAYAQAHRDSPVTTEIANAIARKRFTHRAGAQLLCFESCERHVSREKLLCHGVNVSPTRSSVLALQRRSIRGDARTLKLGPAWEG